MSDFGSFMVQSVLRKRNRLDFTSQVGNNDNVLTSSSIDGDSDVHSLPGSSFGTTTQAAARRAPMRKLLFGGVQKARHPDTLPATYHGAKTLHRATSRHSRTKTAATARAGLARSPQELGSSQIRELLRITSPGDDALSWLFDGEDLYTGLFSAANAANMAGAFSRQMQEADFSEESEVSQSDPSSGVEDRATILPSGGGRS